MLFRSVFHLLCLLLMKWLYIIKTVVHTPQLTFHDLEETIQAALFACIWLLIFLTHYVMFTWGMWSTEKILQIVFVKYEFYFTRELKTI